MVISPCVIKTRLSVSCLGFGEQGPRLRECPRTELSEPRGSSPCTRLGLPAGTGVQNCWKKSFQPPSNIDEERSGEGGEGREGREGAQGAAFSISRAVWLLLLHLCFALLSGDGHSRNAKELRSLSTVPFTSHAQGRSWASLPFPPLPTLAQFFNKYCLPSFLLFPQPPLQG